MFKNIWRTYYKVRIFETWEENRYKMDMRSERGRIMRWEYKYIFLVLGVKY